MKKVLLFCVVLLCLGSFAYAQEDYEVAEVAGVPIYFSQVDRAAQGLNKYLRENFMMSENWRLEYIRKHIANIALAKRAYRRLGTGSDTAVFGMHFSQQRAFADKLRQARLSQVKVTEADYKSYYEKNKDNYKVSERLKVSYLKLEDEKTKPEAEMSKVEHWISKDMAFEAGIEGLKEGIPAEVFSLEAGQTSEPIEGEGAYYIIRVDEKEDAYIRPYEEVKSSVEFAATRKKKDDAISDLTSETFLQENVTIFEDRILEQMRTEQAASEQN